MSFVALAGPALAASTDNPAADFSESGVTCAASRMRPALDPRSSASANSRCSGPM